MADRPFLSHIRELVEDRRRGSSESGVPDPGAQTISEHLISIQVSDPSGTHGSDLFLEVARFIEIRRVLPAELPDRNGDHTLGKLASSDSVNTTLAVFLLRYVQTGDPRLLNSVLKAADPTLGGVNGYRVASEIFECACEFARQALVDR